MKIRYHRNLLLQLILSGSLLCTTVSVSGASLTASWVTQPHEVAARFDRSWQQARDAIRLDNGWLFARNDSERLYLLIDLTGDTVDDQPKRAAPWGDFVSVAFDVDLNGGISADKDLQYSLYPGSHRLGRQYYKGPAKFSGLQLTQARLAAGFTGSPVLQRKHRIWEFSIPLKEVEAHPGGRVMVGVSTHSERPKFSDKLPSGYLQDLKGLIEIRLAANPTFAVFTKISSQDLRKLVAGQRMVVRPKIAEAVPRPGQPGGLRQQPSGPGRPPNCPVPEGEPVKRAIHADGTVELTYSNGSKKLHFQGGWKILCPDGTPVPTTVLFSTQIPPTMPPTLPDQAEMQWLEYHNMRLLGIINMLVNDQTMVDNYLHTEPNDWSVYERIQKRSETISYLLAE